MRQAADRFGWVEAYRPATALPDSAQLSPGIGVNTLPYR